MRDRSFSDLGFQLFCFISATSNSGFLHFLPESFQENKSNKNSIFCILYLIHCGAIAFSLTAQVMWYFDINDLASKSSTSGLLFVWLPIYATTPGLATCLIAMITNDGIFTSYN